jgi:hypothetical protein
MSPSSSSSQSQSLDAQIAHLTQQIKRQDAVRQIHNLVGRMALLYEAGLYAERLPFIAQQTPGVSIEIGGRGVFKGLEGARRTSVDIEDIFEQSHAKGMQRLFPDVQFPSAAAESSNQNYSARPSSTWLGMGRRQRAS